MLCKYTSSAAEYQKARARKPRIESRSSTGTWLHLRNHLGFGKHAAKSTLADANTKRDYRIFEEFAYKVIAKAQRFRIVDIFDRGYNDLKPMKWKHLINRYYQPLRFRFTYIYQGMTHRVGMVLPQRKLYQSHLSLLSDYLQGLRFFGRNLLRDTET